MPGFRVSECWTYGHRGQRCGLNLCVSPSLPEPEFVFVFRGVGVMARDWDRVGRSVRLIRDREILGRSQIR